MPVAMPVAVVALSSVAVGITGNTLFVDGADNPAEAVEESPTVGLSLVE